MRIPAFIRNYRAFLPRSVRNLPAWQQGSGALIIVLILVIVARQFVAATPDGTAVAASGSQYVQVESIADLATQAKPLSVVGEVKSKAQASILAQTSGEVVSLSRAIGDRVGAGSIIGQFENSSQRAALTQAQGAYDAAQASLQKLTGTTAANTGISSAQAATAAENAATTLAIALRSAYASFDDALHAKADTIFIDPRAIAPKLQSFTIPNSQLVVNIQNQRTQLNTTMNDALAASDVNSTADIAARTQRMISAAIQLGSFLDDAITALNQSVPNNYFTVTQLSTYQASLTAARTEVVTAVSGITAAKGAYDAALSGAQTASNSATTGTESDIAAARASLTSAQGTLDAARAALEKTIIRAPISGTIVSLPITRGDFVSAFSPVATISNPGALYVEANVTPDDAKTLNAGNSALMEGSVPGVITFVAPALDPSTGKILVKIGITGSQSALTDGDTVSVSLTRNPSAGSATASELKTIAIPIVSVKITPDGPVVFSVSASSTLEAHAVQLGSILGDRIVITGADASLQIITDARGRSEGEQVIVATSSPAY